MLLCGSPQETSCSSGQTLPLEGGKLGSYRYTHNAFGHLKYSSTPESTWREDHLFSLTELTCNFNFLHQIDAL